MKYNRLIFNYYNLFLKSAYSKITSRNWEWHKRQNRLTFVFLFVFYACYGPFLDHVIINLAGYNCSDQCIWYFPEISFKRPGSWVILKFIPRNSDSANFYQNSFRGPLISRTFIKFIPRTSGFAGCFLRSAGSARSSGSAEFTWPSQKRSTPLFLGPQHIVTELPWP